MGYRQLAHTADLRAALEAPDLEGLYRCATDLVRELVVGSSPVAPRQERELPLVGEDEGERFFRFVRELVYLHDTEGFLPLDVTLRNTVRVRGELFDPTRHHSERQLKAITRHGFRFEQRNGSCRAELLFDV